MKRLLVCLTLAAFATVGSLQAADQCTKDKAASCSAQSQGCCSSSAQTTSTSKCSTQQPKVSKVRPDSVKGATLLVQR